MKRKIGTGVLTWTRYERIGDRYGAVYLIDRQPEDYFADEKYRYPVLTEITDEPFGRLTAKVLETRESGHIGDLFRGLFPTTPEVGEEIVLGEGYLFYAHDGDIFTVGLDPRDGRASDWLDPRALYRAHEQTVELWFEHL